MGILDRFKTIIALILALTCSTSLAGSQQGCNNTLNACISYSKEQDKDILQLKQYVKQLEDKAARDDSRLVPAWVYVVVGVAGGITLGRLVIFK